MKPVDLLSAYFATPPTRALPTHDRPFPSRDREEAVSFDELIHAAEKERILPALHSRFQELGILSQLPAEVANFLSAVEQLNLDRNHAILTELATVATLLNQAGIEPVLLKGAAYFATGVYENPATRYLRDIDLLIAEPQLLRAVDILKQNGFEPDLLDKFGDFRHHHPPLWGSGCASFELHHSLGMGICRSLLPASEVLEQSLPFNFHGARVRVPSPEHLMTHLVLHSQIVHPYQERIWPPLRAMLDFLLLQRRFGSEINWMRIERRFRDFRQYGVLAMHLVQLQNVLGIEMPFPIRLTGLTYLRWLRRKLLRKLPVLRYFDPVYMYAAVLVRRLRLLGNALRAPGGWRYILKHLFAPGVYQSLIADVLEGRGH